MEKGIAQSFYLVDKGQIEAANPPDWRFVVVNPNPVPIKLSFQNSTEIDKICLLAIWSVGYNARSESLKLSRKIPLTSAAICLNFDPDDLNNITNFELELNPGFYYLFGASLRVTSISNSALVQISTNYEYISINISYAKIHTHLDLQILQNVGTDSNPFLPITILDLNYSSSVYHNLHMLIPSHSPWQAIEKTKLYGDLKFVFVRNKTFPNFDYPLIYDLYESPRDSLEQLGILLGQLDHTINRPPIAKFEQQRVIDKIVNGFRVHDPNISEQFHTIQIRFDEAMYQIALPGRNSHDKVIQGSHEVSIEVVVHSTKKYQMFLELNNPFPWETLYYFYTPEQRTAIARIFQEEDFRPCPTDELMEISYSCISCSNLNHFLRSANLRKHESDIIFSEGDNENRPCNLPNLPLDSLESKSHVSLKQNQTIYFGPIEVSNNTANILLSKPFLIFNNVTGWTKLNLEFTPYVTNVSVTWTKAAFNQDNNPFVRLSINNTGSRPIVITDVDFDGYGCKTQTFTGRWNIFRTEPTKQMLVNGFCEHLPMKIERLSSNQLDILLNLGCSARLSGGLSVLVTESADDDMLLKFDTYLIGEQTKDFSCFKDGISRTKTSLLLIVILCLILLIFSIWGFAQKFLHYFSMQQLKNPMLAGKKLTSSSLIRSKLKVLNNRQNFEKKLSIVLADIKVNDDCSRPQIIEEVRRKINSVQNRKDSILSLIQDRATKDDVHVLNLTRSDYDNIDGSNYNFDAIKSAAPNLIGLKEPTELLDVIEHEYYHMTYDDDDIVDSPIFEYNGELDTFYIPSLGRLSHQVRQEVDDLDIDPVLNPSRAIQVQHKVDLTMKGIIEVQDDDDVFLEYDHNCEDIVMGVISDDEESIKSAENNYDGTNVWEQMNNLSPNDTQSTFFGKDNFFANLGEIDSNLLLELEENPLQNIH